MPNLGRGYNGKLVIHRLHIFQGVTTLFSVIIIWTKFLHFPPFLDLLVGAFSSSTVVLLKSRPIINVTTSLEVTMMNEMACMFKKISSSDLVVEHSPFSGLAATKNRPWESWLLERSKLSSCLLPLLRLLHCRGGGGHHFIINPI